jgi:hypothetical protein
MRLSPFVVGVAAVAALGTASAPPAAADCQAFPLGYVCRNDQYGHDMSVYWDVWPLGDQGPSGYLQVDGDGATGEKICMDDNGSPGPGRGGGTSPTCAPL